MPNETKLPLYKRKIVQIPAAVVVVLFCFSLFVMVINYSFPGFFTPMPAAGGSLGEVTAADYTPGEAPPQVDLPEGWKPGLMMANTLLVISEDLFSNWLPNDRVWPTIFLDNPQNHQLGQLEMMRYTTRVLRDKLSREDNNNPIDADVNQVFSLLSNDPFMWVLPSAESRYRDEKDGAIVKIRSYRDRLAKGEADFFAKDDYLSDLLDQYVSLLGSVNAKLANAPRHQRYKLKEDADGDPVIGEETKLVDTKVPWSQIDDNFYYAQGAAYVLRQIMVAVKYDFAGPLANKGATAQVDSIIEVLNQAQFEPIMVLNGDVGSVLANHSMELHSLLENARQRLRNLSDTLRVKKTG